ncbi:hypothetical protein PYCC9005_001030 [Savitreella phatthalungensis]
MPQLDAVWSAFKRLEAIEIAFSVVEEQIVVSRIRVDPDAAFRRLEWASLRGDDIRTAWEKEADKAGLIFADLGGDIGCVVNGAGLAMATNDVISLYGGKSANFFDTGGQATTALLIKGFDVLLRGPHTRAVLVNIYGGLIRCDMIAESVVAAVRELQMKDTPVVIRLRGTNMDKGRQIIESSGLSLTSCDAIEDAAKAVIEQAKLRQAPATATVPSGRRQFHTSSRSCMDDARRAKVLRLDLDRHTRVVYQGFTGRQATINARDTIAYGTNVVGGVSPGKGGQRHLELPVFNTIREAVADVDPDVSAVFVPAAKAADAIIAAIQAQIPLVVAVMEGVPIHDMLRVHDALRLSAGKTRLIGPNCPGTIVPRQCRVGIMPYLQYEPGCIGIVSKSGTLSYETVGETTRVGLGQSLVVGMGGDMLAGTSLVDALRIFVQRADTRGIVVLGEIGGLAEAEAASFIAEYNKTPNPKPIVAMIAGFTAPEMRVMGHAGALRMPGDLTAAQKTEMLATAGCHIVQHTGQIGATMERLVADYDATCASLKAHHRDRAIRGLILGAPGAGKGTHSKRIMETFEGIVVVSSGDLLRQQIVQSTDLGIRAKAIVEAGQLIDDDLMCSMVLAHLRDNQLLDKSFVLDGFPRTIAQARTLDRDLRIAGADLTAVINLDVPREVILDRIVNRWIHAPSGRTYNLTFNPPKVPGQDDLTGERLTQRADDVAETFTRRLAVYDENTAPLKHYYEQRGILVNFRGETSDIIWPQIEAALQKLLNSR